VLQVLEPLEVAQVAPEGQAVLALVATQVLQVLEPIQAVQVAPEEQVV
jgi:hypothetical protein